MQFLVGEERSVVPAGTLVVIPSGTSHTFATVGDAGARILVVMTPEVAALVDALHRTDLTADSRPDITETRCS